MLQAVGVLAPGRLAHQHGEVEPHDARHPLEELLLALHLAILIPVASRPANTYSHVEYRSYCKAILVNLHINDHTLDYLCYVSDPKY